MKRLSIFLLLALGAVCLAASDTVPPAPSSGSPESGSSTRTDGDTPEELYKLGRRYAKGDGVPSDKQKAASLYRKAAEKGFAKAQTALGLCYVYATGLPQDYSEAVRWFRKAAEQGDPNGEYNLGIAFHRGNGVPKNSGQGIEWLRKAAGHGDTSAQCFLGIEYAKGTEVPKNYDEATRWLNLGLAQGKAGDFLRCENIIPPPVNPPQVKINGVNLHPDERASVRTPFGVAVIRCLVIRKENIEILVDGEDTPRTLGKSGPADVRSRLLQAALIARSKLEHEIGSGVVLPSAERSPSPPTTANARPPIIIHGRQSHQYDPPPAPPAPTGANAGTGFFVTEDGYLVTCEHVLRGASSFQIRSSASWLDAKVIRKDRSLDVAVLKVDGAFRALSVEPGLRLKLGDAVFTIGFPNPDVQGIEPKLTRGEISSLTGIQDSPSHFQISVPVQPGNSGGALVDGNGNVVGVIVARLDDIATYKQSGSLPQNVNYALKGSLLWSFLNTVPELSGKLKVPRMSKDSVSPFTAAEVAAVLVIAGTTAPSQPSLSR